MDCVIMNSSTSMYYTPNNEYIMFIHEIWIIFEDRLLGCGSVFKEEFIYSILEYFNLYINKILFLVSYEYMNVNNDS